MPRALKKLEGDGMQKTSCQPGRRERKKGWGEKQNLSVRPNWKKLENNNKNTPEG